jgi:predicted 3-demethylubiquinone-9 3-methyltransferase (glyoxalase superfamily)
MPQITSFLWFDGQAEEAAEFYVSVFPNSRILDTTPYPEGGPGEPGSTMVVSFELDGRPYLALNGGPGHPFTDAISFQIHCDTQEEVDHYWDGLLAGGGSEVACGWLTDRFGLSWQVTPNRLLELITSDDTEVAQRVNAQMMTMTKLDIAPIEAAAAG